MVDLADTRNKTAAPKAEPAERRPMPRWVITLISICCALTLWEIFGRNINPIFGSYPSAIAVAFWELLVSGQLGSALYSSLRPFVTGYSSPSSSASRSAWSSAASAWRRPRSASTSPPATPCRWSRWCRC